MIALPAGTVTFLYTDIEGSTKLWEQYPQEMHAALARHDALLRQAIEPNGGTVFRTEGDAFRAAFPTAMQALEAALDAQRALAAQDWPSIFRNPNSTIRIRVALHAGAPLIRDGEYHGPALNRVARLISTGYGGQTLLSQPTHDLVRDALPEGVTLRDLGEHRLKDLQRPEHIFQVIAPGLPDTFPPLITLSNRPNNLPAQRSPIIGREKELAAITGLLLRDNVGLLTLTGPGGTGKTRLSLQVAADLIDRFEDGVYFVPLAAVGVANMVVPTIVQTLGITELANRPLIDTLKDYLRNRHLLLVLDNFEQILGASPIATELLSAAPRLKVLVTSRSTLQLYGEHDFPVPPLALPDRKLLPSLENTTQYEAVRLFIERATAVKPTFQVTNENAPAVAEICYRLDGLPLAIELAAARIAILSPQAMLARLQSRLQLLTSGARDLPARQQTLRGAIEWSYDLLDEHEQLLFRRLSVFAGGCTLEAAESVCGNEGSAVRGQGTAPQREPPPNPWPLAPDILDVISSLVRKSLLRQEDGAGGEPRFMMLETIKEYAFEKLAETGEAREIQRRHATYFAEMAVQIEPGIIGPLRGEFVERVDAEYDNIRAAADAAKSDPSLSDTVLTMLSALFWFWNFRRRLTESRALLDAALVHADPTQRSSIRARALYSAGFLAFQQGGYSAALPQLEESVAIWRELGDDDRQLAYSLHVLGMINNAVGDPSAPADAEESVALFRRVGDDRWGLALALFSLGDAYLSIGDYGKARAGYEESISLFRQLGDRWGVSLPINSLGRVAYLEGDCDRAREHVEEGLALRRREGDKWLSAISLASLAEVTRCQGDYARSQEAAEEALHSYTDLGDASGKAWALFSLGYVAYYRGDYPLAASLLQESLRMRWEQGSKDWIALCLAALAVVVGAAGQSERAAMLFGAADVRLEAGTVQFAPSDRAEYERVKTAVKKQGDKDFQTAYDKGRAMQAEEAVNCALATSITV